MQISRENGKSKCLFYITKEKHESKKNPVKKIILFYRYKKNLKIKQIKSNFKNTILDIQEKKT